MSPNIILVFCEMTVTLLDRGGVVVCGYQLVLTEVDEVSGRYQVSVKVPR